MFEFILGFCTASALWFFFGTKMKVILNKVWEFLKKTWQRITAGK